MEERDFQEITIAEICAEGNLSRSTFYNHFNTKEEVIMWSSETVVGEYIETHLEINEDWVERLIYYFFQESRKHQNYLSLLMKHKLFHLHRIALLEVGFVHRNIVKQRLYMELPEEMRRYLVRAYVDCALSFYEEWQSTNFALSIEEVRDMYLDIIHNPNEEGK